MLRSYDSWLTDYDGWLESQPRAEYKIEYDQDEEVYMVLENNMYLESFKTESDAESYIDYLLGV
jgi:accessory colonization factor AcfC